MADGIRPFNEKAASLYDAFVAELGRWHKVPLQGSEWNDKGTIRYREYYVRHEPLLADYDESTTYEHVEMLYVLSADMVDEYIRYCAMEDALERFNGKD